MHHKSQSIHLKPSLLSSMKQMSCCCFALMMVIFAVNEVQAEQIYSKSRRFRIPFQFDSAELNRLGTREVQLFVSRDGGNQWKMSDSVSPETSKFTFEANDDGVYLFSVKTVSASGLLYPAGPHQAGLEILVDSTPPQFEMSLTEVEPGRVKLSWEANDTYLDSNSLKLEYSEQNTDVWKVVAIRPQSQGQTTWTSSQAGKLTVRGSVADLAGNITEASTSCDIAGVPKRTDKPDYGRPVAAAPKEVRPAPQEQMELRTKIESAPRPISITPKLTAASANEPAITLDASVNSAPLPSKTADAVASRKTSFAGNGVHLVNSNTFRIGYSLDGIGPSGVKQVDLFITEDNGAQWYHYGQDSDRTSPVEITVPRDGEYGLSFRVTNGLGKVGIPPQPNEFPEVRVIVDRTAPVGVLHPLQPGDDPSLNNVRISWEAKDPDLVDQPISLYFSYAATGPWELIKSDLPNTQFHDWSIPQNVDQPFYVRMDIRDRAGNSTRVYTAEPFVVDQSVPKARITEVESLNSATR
ncbi:Ig-like domain repeat protein [Planctomicrobium sp. SH668]|uniref:Ig-like domain repeat protein n=1 Tax=Planctomicrobium sp. SH668 TaxID=3448126 RepID=UPI003F5BBC8C